jgi:DNA segregation ATPase FtsK/SpoIIIE-like protein
LLAAAGNQPVPDNIVWTAFGIECREKKLGPVDSARTREQIRRDLAALMSEKRSPAAEPDAVALGASLKAALAEELGIGDLMVSEPLVTPTAVRFGLKSARALPVGLTTASAGRIARAAGTATAPFLATGRGWSFVEIQRESPQVPDLDRVLRQLPPASTTAGGALLPVGLDELDRLVSIDLDRASQAHVAVAGKGGLNWSQSALTGLLAANTPDTLRLILMAARPKAFQRFARSPFLIGPDALVTPETMPLSAVLARLVDEMTDRRRYMAVKSADNRLAYLRKTGRRLPRILCVCHRYDQLVDHPAGERSKVARRLERIGTDGGRTGIHLIVTRSDPPHRPLADAVDVFLPVFIQLGRPEWGEGLPAQPIPEWPHGGGVLHAIDRSVWLTPYGNPPAPDETAGSRASGLAGPV